MVPDTYKSKLMQLCISLPCLTKKAIVKKIPFVKCRGHSSNEFIKKVMNGMKIMYGIHYL